ncbi:hypothetical protein NE237_000773 [Protea cynaroides]|uniref:DUF7722 domain-containing protein n=1 Tax=Protea cynaroides TaxID=273540 RepID=A0A9Q0KRU4_9MAGN|nr:hypothetical protein NE237_000773 [Protea cynaroides]
MSNKMSNEAAGHLNSCANYMRIWIHYITAAAALISGKWQQRNEKSKMNNESAGHLNGCANYTTPAAALINGKRQQMNEKYWCFQMPLHYPRYKKSDYETMPEWQLDSLLFEYGLPMTGDLACKRSFAMGAFLWPSQTE